MALASPVAPMSPPVGWKDTDTTSISNRTSFDKGNNVRFNETELPPRPLAYKRKDVAREKLNHAGRTLKKFAKFIGPG